jgi:HSP20 family protein
MVTTTNPNKTKPEEAVKAEAPVPAPRGEMPAPFGDFPFSLSRLRDEFDRLFERMSGRWPTLEWPGRGWHWGLDVQDEADAVVVRAEAPGFEPGDFNIEVRDNQLILHAEKKTETKGKEGEPREWSRRSSYQAVTIPGGIAKDKVEAKYRNGVLTVTLPKTAEGKGRRITVKGD